MRRRDGVDTSENHEGEDPMKIVIAAIGKGGNMKRLSNAASASALLLSLGVLPGCGLLGRTVPDGFYGEPQKGVKIRPTDPGGNVRYVRPAVLDRRGGRDMGQDGPGRQQALRQARQGN